MLFESFRFSTTLSEGSASLLPVGIIGIKKEPDASGEVSGETPEARATSDSGISVADLLDLVNAADGIATAKKRYVLLANCVKLFTLVRKSEYLCCDKTHTTVLDM